MSDEHDTTATRLYAVEIISSVCWFLMDASWMFGLTTLAVVLAVLTIATSLAMFLYIKRTASEFLITGTMVFWASMNVCWMLTDTQLWPGGLALAAGFFAGGSLCLAGAFLTAKNSREGLASIVGRFRRLRIVRQSKPPIDQP